MNSLELTFSASDRPRTQYSWQILGRREGAARTKPFLAAAVFRQHGCPGTENDDAMLFERMLSERRHRGAPSAAMRRATVLAIGALMLAGCETTAQQQHEARWAYGRTLGEQIRGCTSRLRAEPDFAPIYQRLDFGRGGAGPSLAQRMDRARPTAQEAATLVRWHAAEAECRDLTIDGLRPVFPELTDIIVRGSADRDRVLLALANRELRWSEAVDRLEQINTAVRSDIAHFARRYRASVARAHSREVAARNAALGAALSVLAAGAAGAAEYAAARRPVVVVPTQPIAPLPTRLQTNCRFIGPPINELQCN